MHVSSFMKFGKDL